MKRVFILIIFLFMLTSCINKEVHIYQDNEIESYEKLFSKIGNGKTKAYDLRGEDECFDGRIPKFFCSREINSEGVLESLDLVYERLTLMLGDDYNYLVILIDEDGSDSKYLAEKLFAAGYYNVHYFENGYNRYVEIKGDQFIPETGDCDC